MAKRNADKFIDKLVTQSDINEDLVEKIPKYYRAGLRDSVVANMAGISYITLREWLLRGAIGSGSPLYRVLFDKCREAVGVLELEFINEIRKSALGSPAEFAYNTNADGSRTVALDGEGKPIVLKSETKANPQWAAWMLERRFREAWMLKEGFREPPTYMPDDLAKEALHQSAERQDQGSVLPIKMTKEEELEMVDELRAKILESEKDVT